MLPPLYRLPGTAFDWRIQIVSHPDKYKVPISVQRAFLKSLTRPIVQRRMLFERGLSSGASTEVTTCVYITAMSNVNKIEQFKQLIEMDQNDAVLRYGLGVEYLRQEKIPAAVEEFRRTLELKPDYSAAYRDLGRALEQLDQNREAVEVYRKGIGVAKQNGDLQTIKEIEVFLKRMEVE